jgi:hypothetical protein
MLPDVVEAQARDRLKPRTPILKKTIEFVNYFTFARRQACYAKSRWGFQGPGIRRRRDTTFRARRRIFLVRLCDLHTPHKEGGMRTLVFGAVLLALASVGFNTLITSSLAAARDAKAATFSERCAPVLNPAATN